MHVGKTSWAGEILESLLPRLRLWAHGRLPAFARRRMDTEDLVQEATLAALRRLPEREIRRAETLEAYLHSCIRNRVIDEVRRARIGEVRNVDRAPSATDLGASPLDDAVRSERRRNYRRALLQLSADDQFLVVGRIDLQLSYETLARISSRPSVAAARMATRRALLKIARLVRQQPKPAGRRRADDRRRDTGRDG